MKYLQGETLDGYVARKDPQREGLPLTQVVSILARVAVALDYAHENDVIHRDIKPGNIFLVKEKDKIQVQVIDFGLADEIRSSLVRTSQVQIEISGTRPYMSPEQWRGRAQSAATDQYALAVVAHELLAGRLPFMGNDIGMLRMAVMHDAPEQIETISKSANDVLQKALAKDATNRFPTCRKFISALNATWTSVEQEAPPQSDLEIAPPAPSELP